MKRRSVLFLVGASFWLAMGQACTPQTSFRTADAASSLNGDLSSTEPPIVVTPTPTPVPIVSTATQVCASGCAFALPSAAVAAASAGDVIEIHAGDYDDCVVVNKDNLTLRGTGGYAHFTGRICGDKGIIVTTAKNAVLENLELSGYSNASENAAGIRHDATAQNLTVRNVSFHDGEFGILGSSQGDVMIVDGCLFDHIGQARTDGEINVPIFVDQLAQLWIRNSQFYRPSEGASTIKTRALRTVVDCSVIANLEGDDSYNLDFYSSPDVTLINSVIEQSAQTQNSNMVIYGTSGSLPATNNNIRIQNNVFINDNLSGTFINILQAANLQSLNVSGNRFIGPGTNLAGATALGTNQSVADRAAAGMAAYPALPAPGNCTTSPTIP